VFGREDEQPVSTPDANPDDSLIIEEAVVDVHEELVVSRSFDRPSDAPRIEPIGEHVLRESDRTFLRRVGLALQPLRLLLPRDQHGDQADDRKDRPEEEADPVTSASIGLQRVPPTSLGTTTSASEACLSSHRRLRDTSEPRTRHLGSRNRAPSADTRDGSKW
jgi:hypothetical protein